MDMNEVLVGGRVVEAAEEIIVVENREGDIKEVIDIKEVVVERPEPPLVIFVNRLPKMESDGVKRRMTGAEIAKLAGVPLDKAVVKRQTPEGNVEIGLAETLEIHRDAQFFVTRDKVNGGRD